jgi:hypothetical protein
LLIYEMRWSILVIFLQFFLNVWEMRMTFQQLWVVKIPKDLEHFPFITELQTSLFGMHLEKFYYQIRAFRAFSFFCYSNTKLHIRKLNLFPIGRNFSFNDNTFGWISLVVFDLLGYNRHMRNKTLFKMHKKII